MLLSVIDFVNTWPLTWGFLERRVPGVDSIRDIPSACADRLHRGEVDGGLVPVAELARTPGLVAVRGLGIAARGEVRSVLLVSKVAPETIRTVGLDQASRSSAALVRLLLAERHGVRPSFHPGPSDLDEMLAHHDAALLIGDPALALGPAELAGKVVLDLAAEWADWTGLPFVFAVWAIRPGLDPGPFHASRRIGAASLAEIVRAGAATSGRTEDEIRRYLTVHLHHDLGEPEEQGLAEFLARARRAGLLPEGPAARWTDRTDTGA